MPAQKINLASRRVIDDFIERLAAFELNRFYYTIVPDDESTIAHTLGCCSTFNASRAFNLKRMRFAVASDDAILLYRDEFLRRFSRSDQGFQLSGPSTRNRSNPYLWPDDTESGRRRSTYLQLKQLKQRFAIGAQLTFYHPVAERPGWLGIFNLFSDKGRQQLSLDQGTGLAECRGLLEEYADTFNALAFRSINPLANFGVLSPTCIQILSLVAQGYSSEEIGEQLFMSERGVNYHLDRARQIMMARNRANLVSKAYLHGVL